MQCMALQRKLKRMKKLSLALFALIVSTVPGTAQQVTRRANINGNAVDGKCTIEVVVDGSAEIEVQGDVGQMRNLSGSPAVWRRFECNGRMPANPHEFRFRGIDGRGDVQLLQDPRQTGGRIVFRIDDRQGGREGYTVDLEWRGSNNGQFNSQDSRGWRGPGVHVEIGPGGYNDGRGNNRVQGGIGAGRDGYRDRRYYDDRGGWNAAGIAEAVRVCQAAAADQIERDGFRMVTFRRVVPDNNPGRNDFINGFATARQGRWRNANFQFSCSVNLANGNVRSVDVNRVR